MKRYWYSFSFDDGRVRGSVYIGWESEGITVARIKEAKDGAMVSQDAVLIAACFLGRMTREEFAGNAEGEVANEKA